ncbi:MAG: alpha-L-fucosidase [Lentisphaeria bacterium]|nr:alpha-L-fucosidase [Lentisphaeria bacterium]
MEDWFDEARFGMFVHWGLYAVTGGIWQGMDVPWVSEWLMRKFKIPIPQYEQLAARFKAEKFNAELWAETARDAGMKYMIVTSKHHDGFSMFKTAYDRYNVVDSTPFGKDPMLELARACRQAGIRLGFYYSQDQDWHEKGATGNTWDFREEDQNPAAFQAYLDRKVKPQVRELLTQYGDVAVIWFDTPHQITLEQSADLKDFVHRLQPQCLVSGRVGNGQGDYDSLGDNQLPAGLPKRRCEGLGTMNESWGYKSIDPYYRTGEEILRILGRMAARNTNYLLNVGPDGTGSFPPQAMDILHKTGQFLSRYGEALYGSRGLEGCAGQEFPWGNITVRGNRLYFWIFRIFPGSFSFYGLRSKVLRITHCGQSIPFNQEHRQDVDYHKLSFMLPDEIQLPYVLTAELENEPDYNINTYSATCF